ncbi:hypothetical protein E0Z10_g7127 [Xylaria hypoxylon]|uniref:Uncharacterized protein n=1 Tax=Xylaria hypoxylon TaxID=37992 RepID=A0A4Z0YEM1_9PEZI|nr:hypothetical protein E0Z10_g7127 [Xylaria hypoxylon]
MRSPTEAPQGVQRLQSRDAIPSTCYDSCNNANLEAQSVGMTPELCDSNSVFQSYRSACEDCLNAYMDEPTTRDYLDQNFGQWTDYCNAMAPLPTSVSVFTTISPSLVEETVVVTIPYTLTVFGVKTFVSLTKTLTSFPPLPDTTVIIIETRLSHISHLYVAEHIVIHCAAENVGIYSSSVESHGFKPDEHNDK